MNYMKLLNKDNTAQICSYLSFHEILVVCELRDYIDGELLKETNSKLFDIRIVCSICGKAEYCQLIDIGDSNKCPLCDKYFCVNCKINCRSLEKCGVGWGCGRLYHSECIILNRCEVCCINRCFAGPGIIGQYATNCYNCKRKICLGCIERGLCKICLNM